MIFFYYGEDSFRAKQKIDSLLKPFSPEDKNRYDLEKLEGENIGAEDFFRTVSAQGFLTDQKIVVIKNLLANKKLKDWQEALLSFLDRQKDDDQENYLIFWETAKPDARGKIFKKLSQFKHCEEFAPLRFSQLPTWIGAEAAYYQKSISEAAVKLLINYVGQDLWQMSQEIHKLSQSTKKSEIEEDDVRDLVQAKVDDKVFALIDALGHRNRALALKLMEDKINSGVHHQYLLTMIIRQFRLMIKTKAMGEATRHPAGLAQTLRIHPLTAEKTIAQSQNYSLEQMKKIYAKLLELDEKFKSSAGQEKVLLTKVIYEL